MNVVISEHARTRYAERFGRGHPTRSIDWLAEHSTQMPYNMAKKLLMSDADTVDVYLHINDEAPNVGFVCRYVDGGAGMVVVTVIDIKARLESYQYHYNHCGVKNSLSGKSMMPKKMKRMRRFKRMDIDRLGDDDEDRED